MSKIESTLSAMPWNIKEKIIGFTDLFTRRFVRGCNKELREYVDKSVMHYKQIKIEVFKTYFRVEIITQDDQKAKIEYIEDPSVSCEGNRTLRKLSGPDHIGRAFNDMGAILKYPKTSIGSFIVPMPPYLSTSLPTEAFKKSRQELYENFQKQFSGFNLKVELFEMFLDFSEEKLLRMISNCDPNVLMHLKFYVQGGHRDQTIESITALEQWKSAKQLTVCFDHRGSNFPLVKLAHFNKVMIGFLRISLEQIKNLIEAVTERNNGDFIEIYMKWAYFLDVPAIIDYLEGFPEPKKNYFIIGSFGATEILIFYVHDMTCSLYKTDKKNPVWHDMND